MKIVTVVIPVHNGLPAFKDLIDSLNKQYIIPNDFLRFIVIDDASTDDRIIHFFNNAHFFKRSDVCLINNKNNQGFIRSVNTGIQLASVDSDIIILNSDTLIFGPVFEVLANAAVRNTNVASLTPFTNKGTIASLLNWPKGSNTIFDLEPRTIEKVVRSLNLRSDDIELPTGVGFCMFMSRKAINTIGLFDDETFGRGYGEENDWCQRAKKAGFRNLLCSETFVFHLETQSFTTDEKQQYISANTKKLIKKHKSYPHEVDNFVINDPLQSIRFQVVWALSKARKSIFKTKTVMYTLHSDPWRVCGGTQRHVLELASLLREQDHEVIVFSPCNYETETYWELSLIFGDVMSPASQILLHSEEVEEILKIIVNDVDVLHAHHFKHWPDEIVSIISYGVKGLKLFTSHDYFSICGNENLLTEDGQRYCEIETNETICTNCYLAVATGNFAKKNIIEHTKYWITVLSNYDKILFPSEVARSLFKQGVERWGIGGDIIKKLLVFDNPFLFNEALPMSSSPSSSSKRIVFLGWITTMKGSQLVKTAFPILQSKGYIVEVWGNISQKVNCTVRPYESRSDLVSLANQYPPMVIALPFIWPETFSFTTFEALVLLKTPVIVGRFGNPAAVVENFNCGVIMKGESTTDLVMAVDSVDEDYENYLVAAKNFSNEYVVNTTLNLCVSNLIELYELKSKAIVVEQEFKFENAMIHVEYFNNRPTAEILMLKRNKLRSYYYQLCQEKGWFSSIKRSILFNLYSIPILQGILLRCYNLLSKK